MSAPRSARSIAPNGTGPMPANSRIRRLESGPRAAGAWLDMLGVSISCQSMFPADWRGLVLNRRDGPVFWRMVGFSPRRRLLENLDQAPAGGAGIDDIVNAK